MLLKEITPEELIAIDKYRRAYAYSEDAIPYNYNFAPSEEVLKVWSKEKETLFKMFGEQLILKRHFEYTKSLEELSTEISGLLYSSDIKSKFVLSSFYKEYQNLLREPRFSRYNSYHLRYNMLDLIDPHNLAENKYSGQTFEVKFNEEKKYRVSNGCKISKALGKIAKGFGLSTFEDFRICLSQVLNQKELGGNLVLSIHPIDYITMSDNECGWDSCMSWEREGEYRQGTVEMMNSDCVVVAYLESETPMDFCGLPWQGNKKWRQLFIVNKNVVAGIKSYPYFNEELSSIATNWIKELAERNLNWEYGEVKCYNVSKEWPPTFELKSDKLLDLKREKCNLYFYTSGFMYNDFGSAPFHHIAIGDIPKELLKNKLLKNSYHQDTYIFNAYFDGPSQCMVCGELVDNFDSESFLACEDCQTLSRCSWCGEVSSTLIEHNGDYICSDCYHENLHPCCNCEDDYYKEDMCEVVVIPRLSKEEQKTVFGKTWYYSSFNEKSEYTYCDRPYYFCEYCLEDFIAKQDYKVYKSSNYDYSIYFIYFDDLKDDNGFFEKERYSSNEEYSKSFNPCSLVELGELIPVSK